MNVNIPFSRSGMVVCVRNTDEIGHSIGSEEQGYDHCLVVVEGFDGRWWVIENQRDLVGERKHKGRIVIMPWEFVAQRSAMAVAGHVVPEDRMGEFARLMVEQVGEDYKLLRNNCVTPINDARHEIVGDWIPKHEDHGGPTVPTDVALLMLSQYLVYWQYDNWDHWEPVPAERWTEGWTVDKQVVLGGQP